VLLAACTKTNQVATTASNGAPGAPGGAHNSYTIPHTLRIGDTQDITSLNPHLATAASLGNLSQLTMAYLVKYDVNNRPVPELATEVPSQANGGVSKDGLTITWHLRKGVKWSDGAPFDADDVVWSTNAVNNQANNEIGRDGWELITKIDEPDKYTVVYHLSKTYSGFLPTFFGSAGANPCILPKHLLASLPNFNNADYNSKPVGIGPFRYVRWIRNDRVELEPNPYYWRGVPKLKHITYRFIPDRNTLVTQLQTGEVDLWPKVGSGYFDRVKALPNLAVSRFPSYYYAHVTFNVKHPAVSEPAVRLAIAYATDRETIRTKVNHGTGTLSETPVTPVSPMRTDRPLRAYDLAKANALLDEAGWVKGSDGVRAKNGVRLALQFITYTGAPDNDQLIELLRQSWAQIGVQFDVKRVTQALFFAPVQQGGPMYGGKFDVTSFSWGATPDEDYTPQLNCDGIPPQGQNVSHFCDRGIQDLLLKEKAAYDEPDRKTVIAKLDERLADTVPYFVLYIRDEIHAYNHDLQNFHPNSSTPFDDLMNVDI
jgi:peptide/nickel transport system substrate-binding protein